MPAKNRIKLYVENSYYHIYNRGVEKRTIFQDEQDYNVFLNYLKQYLLPKDEEYLTGILTDPNTPYREKDDVLRLLRLNNFADEITLLAYCLMGNHFHFLIKQKNSGSIDKFMNSLCTRYTMYFNKKYNRVGSLYQGVYKAVMVETNEQLLYLSRYIHKQALGTKGQALKAYPSSYLEYAGNRQTDWIHPEEILAHFSKSNPKLSYKAFIAEQDDFERISKLTLENN